jgi:alpha-L-fucosidase
MSLPDGPFEPTWESLAGVGVPKWYMDGKFGIFIHWGVYSVPAFGNEWYPRNMYLEGSKEFEHHVKTWGPHRQFGYKDFIPLFKAEKFDAEAWVDLFACAGAKYVVPVAEHHDGFAMYDSKLNRWNAKLMGPKRDVVGELARAVRKKGLGFGLSNHRAEHWWFMDGGMKFDSDVKDPAYLDFYGPAQPNGSAPSVEYKNDWLVRACELVDLYQPDLYYFDTWIERPPLGPYRRHFGAYYYNRAAEWGKHVAINYKNDAFAPGTGVIDVERGQMGDIPPYFWQSDTAVGRKSWCNIVDEDYKSSRSIICDLADIVSKNGTMLLNIGPHADGSIPQEDARILEEIGAWLRVNGEAIYGTRPWKVYGEGPTLVPEGHFTDAKEKQFTSEDFRFTTRGSGLYAICLGEAKRELLIRSLGQNLRLDAKPVKSVRILGGEQAHWSQDAAGLRVLVPESFASRFGLTIEITR